MADVAGPSAPTMEKQGAEGVDVNRHPSGIVPQLQNVVATVNLDCQLDLKVIAMKARNAEYNPKRFAACIVRIKEPKTTALIFNSGKMVVAGAKSEDQSRLAARKYTRILQKLNFEVKFTDFTVQNMVASCNVQFPIRLEGLAAIHQMFSHYEPEVFPGLVYRMKVPKIVLLIFVTGKIVLTGAKNVDQIFQAFENLYPVLLDFRKSDARRLQQALPAAQPTPALPDTSMAPPPPHAPADPTPHFSIEDNDEDMYIPPPTPMGDVIPPPSPAFMIPPPTPGTRNAIPPPTPGSAFIPPPATPSTPAVLPPPSPYPGR